MEEIAAKFFSNLTYGDIFNDARRRTVAYSSYVKIIFENDPVKKITHINDVESAFRWLDKKVDTMVLDLMLEDLHVDSYALVETLFRDAFFRRNHKTLVEDFDILKLRKDGSHKMTEQLGLFDEKPSSCCDFVPM